MSTAKKIVAAQKSRECTCDHDWPIINWYNIQEKTLQSQHLHETWRQLSCNRFLALLHDAIMSHCELWVDLNLRMGDCFLHSHVITWTLFLAQRETVVDLTGPWPASRSGSTVSALYHPRFFLSPPGAELSSPPQPSVASACGPAGAACQGGPDSPGRSGAG